MIAAASSITTHPCLSRLVNDDIHLHVKIQVERLVEQALVTNEEDFQSDALREVNSIE